MNPLRIKANGVIANETMGHASCYTITLGGNRKNSFLNMDIPPTNIIL